MKKTISIVMLICIGITSQAKEVSLEGGKISFEIPDNFTQLTQTELDLKYPSKQAPRYAVGNESRSVSIAYELKDSGIPPEKMIDSELPNAQQFFTQTFNRMIPGIKWHENKIIELAGKKWIFLELTSNGLDTDIHNIMLISFYEKKLLMFNFNATKESFEKNKADLLKAKASIKIKQ